MSEAPAQEARDYRDLDNLAVSGVGDSDLSSESAFIRWCQRYDSAPTAPLAPCHDLRPRAVAEELDPVDASKIHQAREDVAVHVGVASPFDTIEIPAGYLSP